MYIDMYIEEYISIYIYICMYIIWAITLHKEYLGNLAEQSPWRSFKQDLHDSRGCMEGWRTVILIARSLQLKFA